MNTIDDYKDRFDCPIGITNVRGPHIIDRVTIEFATGNKDMCFSFLMRPKYKERITITDGKISYKFKDFDNDGAETTWSYSSSSEWFRSEFGEIARIGLEFEDRDEKYTIFDVLPIKLAFHYMSGNTLKYDCYYDDPLLVAITEEVARLKPGQEGLPKFMTSECYIEMGLPK